MQARHFAIIADPHFHNLAGNYRCGRLPIGQLPDGMELRCLADTVLSTRLFNESGAALRAVLDDIAARGIRHVVILGDYSDDGQDESVSGVTAIFRDYARRHGLRFFSTVGNHDLYGYSGRSLDRRFLMADGSSFLVSGSPKGLPEGALFNPAMRCRSYDEGLPRALGFFRNAEDCHWETPFGSSDALSDRHYDLNTPDGRSKRRFIDASYLVEPVPGIWLLSIDGNVFVPRDGTAFPRSEDEFDDSTDAGYNALVAHRPYLLEWIADVARRARLNGKRLFAFSHYPAVDPFDGTGEDEARTIGNTIFIRRTPRAAATDAMAATGLGLHFSGHLHIDHVATSSQGGLVNIAVPSTAGYPGGYRILSIDEDGATLESVRMPSVPVDAAILCAYRREAERTGLDIGDLLAAEDSDSFGWRHLREVVRHRFVGQEWPAALRARFATMSLAALVEEASAGDWPSALAPADRDAMTKQPATRFVQDLYIARHNAAYLREMADPDQRARYERLLHQPFPGRTDNEAAALLRMARRHLVKPDPRTIRFDADWKPSAAEGSQQAA